MQKTPLAIAVLSLLIAGPRPASAEVEVNRAMLALFQPLVEVAENPDNPITDEKVDLGRMLYYETRFSENRSVSCNTCHDLAEPELPADAPDTPGAATAAE